MARSSASVVTKWRALPTGRVQVAADVSLRYVDVGPTARAAPGSSPIVLLHGWPDCGFAWRHQIEALSTNHRVIVPDLRGFGHSSAPAEQEAYGAKTITSDLAKLLDDLSIDKAVLIGHDWGATMSWRMCIFFPDRVRAVCSIGIPYYPPTDEFIDAEAIAAMAPQFGYLKLLGDCEATAGRLERAPTRFYNAVFHHTARIPADLESILLGVENGSEPWYSTPSSLLSTEERDYYVEQAKTSGFLGGCRYYGARRLDFDQERELPQRHILQDALYIHVRRSVDEPDASAVGGGMAAFVPRLETKAVDGSGHWVLWEKQTEISALLLEWLARVAG